MTERPDDRNALTASSPVPESAPQGRVILVGARRQLRRLAACLDDAPFSSLPIVGFVDVTGRGRQLVVHPGSMPVPILGSMDRLPELVRQSGATDVVVALSGQPAARLGRKLRHLPPPRVRVHWVGPETRTGDQLLARPPQWEVTRLPLSLLLDRIAKRLLDVTAAAVALLLLAPLLVVVAALILITTGRPIFFTQERVGQGGRIFRIIKFRSMRVDAERETGPIWATDHDTRCTRIGDWLRHTNIDELPQLFNVLCGHMSLVGPRPERPVFVDKFRCEHPDYDFRHAVPVGMTGWAQIHGWRGRTSLRKRLQYDLDYIRHWSFGMDVRIIFMTLQHVFQSKTRWSGGYRWLRQREG